MLSAMMIGAQVAMEALPNIHLTGMFIILFTRAFRKRALIPIYLYVFLIGVRWGFGFYWIPYLYIWTVLWGVTMLLPKSLSRKWGMVLFPLVGALFGLSFGTLYAPSQAVFFGLSFRQTLAWIAAGFPWDVTHAVGNAFFCTLVVPLLELMKKIPKISGIIE